MNNPISPSPKILVIDDIYGWDTGDRKTFCINLSAADITGKPHQNECPPEPGNAIADIIFTPGQKKQNGKVENDLDGTINKIKQGWASPPRWALIILDLQFNTGTCNENGVPTPTPKDRENFFGLTILERIWKDEYLRDIPVIILTQFTRGQIEEKVQVEFSKFDVVWEVVNKSELDRDKLIELLMDYGVIDGRQIIDLSNIIKTNKAGKQKRTGNRGVPREALKHILQEQFLDKLPDPNFTDENIKDVLLRIIAGMEKKHKSHTPGIPLIVGSSIPILGALREARNVARNTDLDVMLLGETGVGKELFAQLIHHCSKRGQYPFRAINCAAIPGQLFEAELFGYMPGAFTDARKEGKAGLLEIVNNGTFLLDEVGELSKEHQAKLLRVIQNREFFRIGGTEPIPLKARLIYATNLDLKEAVKQNKFRADLNFRINFPPIIIPPLRERKQEDIKQLALHFIERFQKKFRKEHLDLQLHKSAEKKLYSHPWNGNVRELEYVIMKAVYRKSIRIISEKDIDLADSTFPGITFKLLTRYLKTCDFETIRLTDLDNTLNVLQKFIIHLLNAGIKVYVNENREGKFVIDEHTGTSINLTGLMKQLTGLEQLSTTNARRLFKNLCEILPDGIGKSHLEELARVDDFFKSVSGKLID